MTDPLAALRERFRARVADDLAQLETLVAKGMQGDELRNLVHNLAGTAGMFGFPDVSAAAGEIDDQLAAGLATSAASLDRLRASMDAVGASRHDDASGEAALDQT